MVDSSRSGMKLREVNYGVLEQFMSKNIINEFGNIASCYLADKYYLGHTANNGFKISDPLHQTSDLLCLCSGP